MAEKIKNKELKETYEKFKQFCKERKAQYPLPSNEFGFFSNKTGVAYLWIEVDKVLVYDTRCNKVVPLNAEFKDVNSNIYLLNTNGGENE